MTLPSRLAAAVSLAFAATLPCTAVAAASPPTTAYYAARDDVQRFAAEVAERHGLDAGWLRKQLAGAKLQPAVRRLIMPAATPAAKNWAAYRDRFVEPQRIAAGLAFWREHEALLAKAEERWGVPAAIVVGIVGVETFYGRFLGEFRVLDALATLAFDFPPGRSDRSAYFRDELEQLLLWCRREQLADCGAARGSYAGASGLGQFMPGSINRYAVDFDADGHVDLGRSAADAIGSIAAYLAAHGWRRGLPTHYRATPPDDRQARLRLLEPDIVPSFSPAQLVEAGVGLDDDARAHPGLLALVEVHNGDTGAPSYYAGSDNFYALTRYNRSSYYALAVAELGAAVAAQR
jgi:membrane-bound lytic murein transglycosylase B